MRENTLINQDFRGMKMLESLLMAVMYQNKNTDALKNVLAELKDQKDEYKNAFSRALWLCCRNGFYDGAVELVKMGADVDYFDHATQQSSLDSACFFKNKKIEPGRGTDENYQNIINLLLQYEAQPTAKTVQLAINARDVDLVKMLLVNISDSSVFNELNLEPRFLEPKHVAQTLVDIRTLIDTKKSTLQADPVKVEIPTPTHS